MTEQLYQVDSYLREFEAVVTAVEGPGVGLDRSAFYPGGGGQPCDLGGLEWNAGSAQVVRVQRQGARVWHTLDGDPPPVGAPVHAVLDWERRYRLMRTHTALHVLWLAESDPRSVMAIACRLGNRLASFSHT